jgi:demethylmenaquinone methyltransferase / 2-methoxy-6-polyprenyl-1,4-benzoquinol methylase
MSAEPDLPDPRPTPDKDAALVQRMFDRVAPRYDLANTIFSLGQDRHWRRVARAAADPRPGRTIVDVAAGTGMLAHELRAAGARVVALDFSWNMLRTGAQRERAGSSPLGAAGAGVLWCNGDGTRLPLSDGSVDAVTIAFGLRNLPDPAGGLAEFARVLRPGGRVVVLEFSRPPWTPLRVAYHRGALAAMPLAARAMTSDPRAYEYLADSIRAWPDQRALAAIMAAAGFDRVRWKNLFGGVVACHQGVRR